MSGKISLILNVLLIAAVIYLFTQIGQPSSKSDTMVQQTSDTTQSSQGLSIAYINIDSLLLNYKFAQKLNEDMIIEESTVRANINRKLDALQKKAETLEANVMSGLETEIKTQEDFQNKIMEYQYEAENYQTQQRKKLEEMTYDMEDTLMSVFNSYIDELVLTTHYDYILKDGIGGSLMHKNDQYNLTDEMLVVLNKRYSETEETE